MAKGICPSCGTHKGIKKLSDIVKLQEDAALIQRIAPPMNPQKSVKPLSSRDILVVVGLAFILTTFLLALQSGSVMAIIIYGFFMIFFLAAMGRLIVNYLNTRKVANALTEPWREAYLIWSRLQYCTDEDLVFDPKFDETAKPEEYREKLLHYPPEIPGITAPKQKH